MPWWLDNRLRLIQNNLRDIDARMDVDALVRKWRELGCNVGMVNAGGITSFFPTKLEYQTPSPFLDGRDTLGEIVEKSHRAGIRVVARFDFSKTHERFFALHPEWYFVSAKGERMKYNDTYQTCPSGWYQQEYSVEIIAEALARYPLDGIFFNYFSFVTRDYSHRQYGICHCEACKKGFHDYCGMPLPASEQPDDPGAAKYQEYKDSVMSGILERIQKKTREFGPEIAICTYHHHCVDIVRNESNSAVDRPYPFWVYNSAANVAKIRTDWDDKIISNCVINAVDIFCRFTGVSPDLTRFRLYENMAEGSGLDWCIIGAFEDYPDRDCLPYVEEVFKFHEKNEKYYGHLESLARVALLQPTGITPLFSTNKNFLGLFKALKERHVPFDVIGTQKVLSSPQSLSRYQAIILPDLAGISPAVLDAVIDCGATVVLTGITGRVDAAMEKKLGFRVTGSKSDTRSAYLFAEDKKVFPSFANRDWVFMDKAMGIVEGDEYENLLPLMSESWFGPPERAFGHKRTSLGGAYRSKHGKVLLVPWNVGELYYQYGYEDHRNLFVDLLFDCCPGISPVETTAPPSVELFWNRCGKGEYLLQLLSFTGFNGTTFARHIPVHGIEIRIPGACAKLRGARSLTGGAVRLASANGGAVVTVEKLEQYEAVVLAE
jgi:hypothetical protein